MFFIVYFSFILINKTWIWIAYTLVNNDNFGLYSVSNSLLYCHILLNMVH